MADRTDNPSDPVPDRIAGYRPTRRATKAAWEHISGWVVDVVAAAAPSTSDMADRLLSAASALAAWAHGESIPQSAWLSDRTIERYVATHQVGSTVRSRLRRLADRPGPRADRPTAIGSRDYAPPLHKATVAAAIHAFTQLPAGPKRRNGLVVVYGAGFVGMDPVELRHFQPHWLTDGQVAIPQVGALSARTVPVPVRVAEALAGLADGDTHLLGGGAGPVGPNAPSAALAPLRAAGIDGVTVRRLRTTFVANLLTSPVPFTTVHHLAGTATAASLAKVADAIPATDVVPDVGGMVWGWWG